MKMPSPALPLPHWPRSVPRSGGLARLVVGIWLAVHGLVVLAAPVADGMLGHRDPVIAHWEDAQDTSCPPQHDPATCQLCQQGATSFGDGSTARVAPMVVARAAGVRPMGPGLGAYETACRGAPRPRGPPAT